MANRISSEKLGQAKKQKLETLETDAFAKLTLVYTWFEHINHRAPYLLNMCFFWTFWILVAYHLSSILSSL